MDYSLLLIALVIAIVDWFAVFINQNIIRLITKPAVMILILLWLFSVDGLRGNLAWFMAGIFFSLWGDIFLALPKEQFIAGLISFLLAHACYTTGFLQPFPQINLAVIVIALLILLVGWRIYTRIATGLSTTANEKLKAPVLIYSIVICLMLFSAFSTLTRPDWAAGSAFLASAGALLFFISDSLLAWNKFIEQLKYGGVAVMVSYHLGQILIVIGAVLHFS